MGILNVTPDSFSDGGVHFDQSKAVHAALQIAVANAASAIPRPPGTLSPHCLAALERHYSHLRYRASRRRLITSSFTSGKGNGEN